MPFIFFFGLIHGPLFLIVLLEYIAFSLLPLLPAFSRAYARVHSVHFARLRSRRRARVAAASRTHIGPIPLVLCC